MPIILAEQCPDEQPELTYDQRVSQVAAKIIQVAKIEPLVAAHMASIEQGKGYGSFLPFVVQNVLQHNLSWLQHEKALINHELNQIGGIQHTMPGQPGEEPHEIRLISWYGVASQDSHTHHWGAAIILQDKSNPTLFEQPVHLSSDFVNSLAPHLD